MIEDTIFDLSNQNNMTQTHVYNTRINAALKAGFEIYLTHTADGCECTILTNTVTNSPHNGECLDIWEEGQYQQYAQFKEQQPTYKVV